MSGFDNELTGILSRNDRKESDAHADFKGSVKVGGVEYWLDAWVKERKDGSGRKFFSLKLKPKQAAMSSGMPRRPATARSIEDDAVPF